jgi:hypothetical protein
MTAMTEKALPKSKKAPEPSVHIWRSIPRRTLVVFLFAVFFIFTTTGFANDIINLGRQPIPRYIVAVLLSGLFAVAYAVAGIHLRGQFWKALIPLLAFQIFVMATLGHWLPDANWPIPMGAADMDRLQSRLLFDGLAIMAAVALGYTGFIYVSIHEGRRYAKARTEMAVLEAEMSAARQVQQVLLPESESFPGYAVESAYKPAKEVGGDFFQIVPVAQSGLVVVFGDVAGKGLPAAMLVSMLVGAIRTTIEDTQDPVLILHKLDERLVGRTSGGFATALAAYIDNAGSVSIANAGHLSPYLDGQEIELPGALPLGVAKGGHYEARHFDLRPGSRLAFFSDGVVEAQNQKGELFGFDRAQAISTKPVTAIVEEAVHFGQADDITVVTIERRESRNGLEHR